MWDWILGNNLVLNQWLSVGDLLEDLLKRNMNLKLSIINFPFESWINISFIFILFNLGNHKEGEQLDFSGIATCK